MTDILQPIIENKDAHDRAMAEAEKRHGLLQQARQKFWDYVGPPPPDKAKGRLANWLFHKEMDAILGSMGLVIVGIVLGAIFNPLIMLIMVGIAVLGGLWWWRFFKEAQRRAKSRQYFLRG